MRVKGCLGAVVMSAFDGKEAGVDPALGALFDGDDGFVLLGDADGNAGPGGSEGFAAEDPPMNLTVWHSKAKTQVPNCRKRKSD